MRVYLASPASQMQAHAASGMPVLMSFAVWKGHKWLSQWLPSFERLLIDSGAFSELNSGVRVDLVEYVEWAETLPWCDAWAGLDDISGDWKRSLKNYEAGGFPTFHDTDPEDLLDDLIPLARENGGWLGIGLKPPRSGREAFLRRTLDRIPDDLHVHGWALGSFTHLARLDSVDSTCWWRDAMRYRQMIPWLTYGEALEIMVKKYQRFERLPDEGDTMTLFAEQA